MNDWLGAYLSHRQMKGEETTAPPQNSQVFAKGSNPIDGKYRDETNATTETMNPHAKHAIAKW